MDPTLVDKIISGDSPAEISDFIKDTLFAKSSARIDGLKPEIANQLFGNTENSEEEITPDGEE